MLILGPRAPVLHQRQHRFDVSSRICCPQASVLPQKKPEEGPPASKILFPNFDGLAALAFTYFIEYVNASLFLPHLASFLVSNIGNRSTVVSAE